MARLFFLTLVGLIGCSPNVGYRTADSTTAAHLINNLEIPECDAQMVQEKISLGTLVSSLASEMNQSYEGSIALSPFEKQEVQRQLDLHAVTTRQYCQQFFDKWGTRPCRTQGAEGRILMIDPAELKTSCDSF